MQRRFRLRFMVISWLLLMLLLIAACVGISAYMYQSSVNDTEKALQASVETLNFPDPTRGMVGVMTDDHGIPRMWASSHMNVTEHTLTMMVKQIEPKGKKKTGTFYYEDVKYRYLSVPDTLGARTGIAECSGEQELMKTLKRNCMIISLLGMLLLVPVCAMLTKWVSKPMEAAWDKQKSFVSDATHELKTPLTVIATNTEAVLANPDATIGSQERWLDSIHGETSRMSGLVTNLLFLAKIDAGEIHLAAEQIPITERLEEMCMERESEFFEAGRVFEYDMTPDLQYYGDWKLIRKMTEELLSNARMYTPEGGTIRMIVNRDRKQRLRMVMSNSGGELKPEELEKLFDRFYRADPSRARETGGYGLGLCVAKSIAELHNGTITAESQNGINVFTVILGETERKDSKSDKKE